MQIGRLFEMVYLLLDKKKVTAGQLAEHFGVSVRTVYRDVEALSQAGIPIYATKGAGGGIRLTDNFVLNKSVLTQQEKQSILASLNGMRAVKIDEADAVLSKLSALFGGERADWIEIDFSAWNPNDPSGGIFNILKRGILGQQAVELEYSGADGKTAPRVVEPLKLVFRERSWYLLAWCRLRQDFRYFKLSRIGQPALLAETFERREPPTPMNDQPYTMPSVEITARIAPALSYRILDELRRDEVQKCEDGSFLVRFSMPDNDWLYQYLLTFGAGLYVIEPPYVREKLYKQLKSACAQYEI
ncbi:helix-turn-helix transcriptional regulator [Oscillospiraceae bacterium LTW-04]|nr:YafY family protein [Oscillospiraceae bacterium MB24-C1]